MEKKEHLAFLESVLRKSLRDAKAWRRTGIFPREILDLQNTENKSLEEMIELLKKEIEFEQKSKK